MQVLAVNSDALIHVEAPGKRSRSSASSCSSASSGAACSGWWTPAPGGDPCQYLTCPPPDPRARPRAPAPSSSTASSPGPLLGLPIAGSEPLPPPHASRCHGTRNTPRHPQPRGAPADGRRVRLRPAGGADRRCPRGAAGRGHARYPRVLSGACAWLRLYARARKGVGIAQGRGHICTRFYALCCQQNAAESAINMSFEFPADLRLRTALPCLGVEAVVLRPGYSDGKSSQVGPPPKLFSSSWAFRWRRDAACPRWPRLLGRVDRPGGESPPDRAGC